MAGRRDDRSPEAIAYRKLYKTARWQRTRAHQLATEPLCRMCKAEGRVTPATVCDHVDPETKASPTTFFDGPFQSLCDADPFRCHSRWKQREERSGRQIVRIGADGWPVTGLQAPGGVNLGDLSGADRRGRAKTASTV